MKSSKQLNLGTAELVAAFLKTLPGNKLVGMHRNPNGHSTEIALEVTAVVKVQTRFGEKPYLFGTRVDADQAGRVQLIKWEAFFASTVSVEPAKGFKQIDYTGWYVRPFGASRQAQDHFGFLDFISEDEPKEVVAEALSMGVRPITEVVMADKAQKPAAAKAKKTVKKEAVAETPAA